MKTKCLSCNQEYSYSPSQQEGKYCSNRCQMFHSRQLRVECGEGSHRQVRQYLIERDIYECVKCGNKGEWMGEKLPLQLDHINGINKDNRLENYQWLCPNCHCQTKTWGNPNSSGKDQRFKEH